MLKTLFTPLTIMMLTPLMPMPETAGGTAAERGTDAPAEAVAQLDLLDAMERGWGCHAVKRETGLFENVLVLELRNPGRPVQLKIEAGTAFHGPDGIQPAVVTEDLMVYVPNGTIEQIVERQVCGDAHSASGGAGTVYDAGITMVSPELGAVLDRMNAELPSATSAIQDMVWVYTNDHSVSSVYVDEADQAKLMRICAEEMAGFEEPGYAVQYREPEPGDEGRFTGEAIEMRCEVLLVLQRPEQCRVVLVQPNGERMVMMENFAMHRGQQAITLTVGLEGYPPGQYAFEVQGQQTRQTHFHKDILIQGQG